jgi:hypothetical protein
MLTSCETLKFKFGAFQFLGTDEKYGFPRMVLAMLIWEGLEAPRAMDPKLR